MNINKKYLIVLLVAVFSIAIINRLLNFDPYNSLVNIKNRFLLSYRTYIENITEKVEIFFYEKNEISEFIKSKEKNKELTMLATFTLNQLNDLLKSYKIDIVHPKIKRVKVISLENLMNYNRLWIDLKVEDTSKIYGLAYNNYAAGIGIVKNGQILAILNSDKNSVYSVHIGKKRVLGVMRGSVNKRSSDIIVNFISLWEDIRVGDEVVTSGLDKIFFQGIKVGVVKKVETLNGFKKAIIEPHFTYNDLGNFLYVIDI